MTTQRKITVAEYIAWTDMFAAAVEILFTAHGDEDTPDTAAAECAAFRDDVVAFTDPDEAEITAAFIDVAISLVSAMELERTLASYFSQFNSAVIAHLGEDLNDWIEFDGTKVHHLFKRGGNLQLSPVNVFPPITILGDFAVSGTDAGTWTPNPDNDAEVDTANYADAQLECEVINQTIGGASITVHVTGTDFDGNSQGPHDAIITSGAIVGDKFDVGTSVDRYATITAVTITGGTNGDDFQIQTKEDRTLS